MSTGMRLSFSLSLSLSTFITSRGGFIASTRSVVIKCNERANVARHIELAELFSNLLRRERDPRQCHRDVQRRGLFYSYLENSRNSLSLCHLVLHSALVMDTWKSKRNLEHFCRFIRYFFWIINICDI